MTFKHGKAIGLVLFLAVVSAGLIFLAIRHRQPGDAVLRVGDQRGAVFARLKSAGELEKLPYRIEWATFPVGAPIVEAIKAGAVDFGFVGSSTVTFGLAGGAPLKVITVSLLHGAGSGLVVPPNSNIRTIEDLRGKRIALVRGSPAHLLVAQLLRNAGIPNDAVNYAFLPPSDARAALAGGSVDAWAIWDPYMAIGERDDHLRVLATSERVTGEALLGVASDDAILTKRAQLTDFLARVQRANQWSETHPEAAARSYAKETGLPLDLARLTQSRLKIELLPRITNEAIAAHQRGADLYADVGVIPNKISVAKAYDRSFVLDHAQ